MKAKALLKLKISIILFVVIRHILLLWSWPVVLSTPYSISYLMLLIIEPMIWMGITGIFNSTKRGAVIAYILAIIGQVISQVGIIFFGIKVLIVWPYYFWCPYNIKEGSLIPGSAIDPLSLLNIFLNLMIIAGWISVMSIIREKLQRKLLFSLLLLVAGVCLHTVLGGYYPGLYNYYILHKGM